MSKSPSGLVALLWMTVIGGCASGTALQRSEIHKGDKFGVVSFGKAAVSQRVGDRIIDAVFDTDSDANSRLENAKFHTMIATRIEGALRNATGLETAPMPAFSPKGFTIAVRNGWAGYLSVRTDAAVPDYCYVSAKLVRFGDLAELWSRERLEFFRGAQGAPQDRAQKNYAENAEKWARACFEKALTDVLEHLGEAK